MPKRPYFSSPKTYKLPDSANGTPPEKRPNPLHTAKGNPSESKKILAREIEEYAFEARRAGLSYSQISKQFMAAKGRKVAPVTCYDAVMRVLRQMRERTAEDAVVVLGMELARLDRLQLALWKLAEGGQHGAVDRILKIMERRAKLLGLDAPVRSDMTLSGTLSLSLIDEIVAASVAPPQEPSDAEPSD